MSCEGLYICVGCLSLAFSQSLDLAVVECACDVTPLNSDHHNHYVAMNCALGLFSCMCCLGLWNCKKCVLINETKHAQVKSNVRSTRLVTVNDVTC